jgi:hypothetical protein
MPKIDTDILQLAQRASAPSAPSAGETLLFTHAGGWAQRLPGGAVAGMGVVSPAMVANGRLTLTSATPVTTSNVSAATTLYYTDYLGDQIALWDTSLGMWRVFTFVEVSVSLGATAANTNYDVFIYDVAGTLTLELVAWSSDSARATSLAMQDNVWVKASALNRRYVGTIRTVAAGQCEDSTTKRFVWNQYNRLQRRMTVAAAASHTYTTAAVRAWNNSTTTQLQFVCGQVEDAFLVVNTGRIDVSVAGSGAVEVGVGHNTTTAHSIATDGFDVDVAALLTAVSHGALYPALGYNYLQQTEYGAATSPTFAVVRTTAMVMG